MYGIDSRARRCSSAAPSASWLSPSGSPAPVGDHASCPAYPSPYLDVSHVGAGVYEVVSRANPDGGILEAASGLETGVTCIRIAGDDVKVLETFPSQSNTAPLPTCAVVPLTSIETRT